jgi:hypothetical protein
MKATTNIRADYKYDVVFVDLIRFTAPSTSPSFVY